MNMSADSNALLELMLKTSQPISANAPDSQALHFETRFKLDQDKSQIINARLMASAHGLYEAELDGNAVSDALLLPGWTSYEWRVRAQDFDIYKLLSSDNNEHVLSFELGNGWYRGKFGFCQQESDYGSTISLIAFLLINYKDGSQQMIASNDKKWSVSTSNIVENSIYNGETIYAPGSITDSNFNTNLVLPGTKLDVFVDKGFDLSTIVLHDGPLTRPQMTVQAVDSFRSPSGKHIFDFGQNLVGWVRVHAKGKSGEHITLTHAEVLEHGEIGIRPLRFAKASDTYYFSGKFDVFEPHFTFHGFRYVSIEGDIPDTIKLEAVVIYSDMTQTLFSETSNSLINQLLSNSLWSQRGNFVDIPTDCPQRDEREGWTGDIAVFAPTACTQFNIKDFLDKWLDDMYLETKHAGFVPMVVPDIVKLAPTDNILEWIKAPTALWGDAAVWVPYTLWHYYGDKDLLAKHYQLMKAHITSVVTRIDENTGLWNRSDFQFGDWLDPVAPPSEPWAAKADRYVIAELCLLRSLSYMADVAHALKKLDDENYYKNLYENTLHAFNINYIERDEGFSILSDCQAVYALAIHFAVLNGEDERLAGNRLAQLVKNDDYHVSTGFAGTPYVLWGLSKTGHIEEAWKMLTQKECPSWLYPVTMGATTIWERWDSMLPDGTINPGDMTSFNHYAFGAVVDWIVQNIFGIAPKGPGCTDLTIDPLMNRQIAQELSQGKVSFESVRGLINIEWDINLETYEYCYIINVPEGGVHIHMPDGKDLQSTDTHFTLKGVLK